MNWKASLASTLILITGVISGCGTTQSHPVSNITVQQSSQTMQTTVPQTIKLETVKGNPISIQVKNRPVFFFAYWCPHCRNTMEAFAKLHLNQNQMPIFISTGSLPTDDLATLVQKSNKDLKQVGLNPNKLTVLYLPGTGEPYTSGYPEFIYQSKSMQYLEVNGEETDLTYWEKVFRDIHTTNM